MATTTSTTTSIPSSSSSSQHPSQQNASASSSKKRKDLVSIEPSPLPGTLKFSTYTGVFITSGVWVVDKEEGQDLYNCGFFGKGILSRGGPHFYEQGSRPNVTANSGFHIKQTKRVRVSRETVSNNNNNNNNNSSSSSGSHSFNPNTKSKQPMIVNTNTKLHEEYLQLSLVESFFLMYGLGCLRIIKPVYEKMQPDQEKISSEEDILQSPLFHQNSFQELSIKQCWAAFCEAQPKFPYLYTVYHHYRTHSWTPKSGLKYGTDFVLYKQGPSFFHAQHTVVVIAISEKDVNCVDTGEDQREDLNKVDKISLAQRTISWGVLNNLNRVSEQVAKGLILCYVVIPQQEEIKSDTPLCLQSFKILEVTVSRFLPTRTRD